MSDARENIDALHDERDELKAELEVARVEVVAQRVRIAELQEINELTKRVATYEYKQLADRVANVAEHIVRMTARNKHLELKNGEYRVERINQLYIMFAFVAAHSFLRGLLEGFMGVS